MQLFRSIATSILGLLSFNAALFTFEARASVDPSAGVDVLQNDWNTLLKVKANIFQPYATQSTFEELFKVFSERHPELDVNQLNEEFERAVQKLIDGGILKLDKNLLISKVPSYVGPA